MLFKIKHLTLFFGFFAVCFLANFSQVFANNAIVRQVDRHGNGWFYFAVPPILQRGRTDCALTSVAACCSFLGGCSQNSEEIFHSVYKTLGKLNKRYSGKRDLVDWERVDNAAPAPVEVDVNKFEELRRIAHKWKKNEFIQRVKEYLPEQIAFALSQSELDSNSDADSKKELLPSLQELSSKWFDGSKPRPVPIQNLIIQRGFSLLKHRISFINFVEKELKEASLKVFSLDSPDRKAFRNALEWRLLDLPMRLQTDAIETMIRNSVQNANPVIVRVWFTGIDKKECLSSLPISLAGQRRGPQGMFHRKGHFVAITGAYMKEHQIEEFLVHDPSPLFKSKTYPQCAPNLKVVQRKDGLKEVAGEGVERFNVISPTNLVHLMIGRNYPNTLRAVEIKPILSEISQMKEIFPLFNEDKKNGDEKRRESLKLFSLSEIEDKTLSD